MTQPKNTIRTFALICVGVTSIFLMSVIIWLIRLLSTNDWCGIAIGAGKSSNRPQFAVQGCYDLLKLQVEALAWNSHIFAFVIALCLLVLMVIVVAGGKVSFKADKTGVSGDIGEAPIAAQVVADAAQSKADEVKQEVKP